VTQRPHRRVLKNGIRYSNVRSFAECRSERIRPISFQDSLRRIRQIEASDQESLRWIVGDHPATIKIRPPSCRSLFPGCEGAGVFSAPLSKLSYYIYFLVAHQHEILRRFCRFVRCVRLRLRSFHRIIRSGKWLERNVPSAAARSDSCNLRPLPEKVILPCQPVGVPYSACRKSNFCESNYRTYFYSFLFSQGKVLFDAGGNPPPFPTSFGAPPPPAQPAAPAYPAAPAAPAPPAANGSAQGGGEGNPNPFGTKSLEFTGGDDPNAKTIRLRERLAEADVERRKSEEEALARERAAEIRREERLKKIAYMRDMPDSTPAGTGK